MRFLTKQQLIRLAAIVLAAVLAAGGYAYFTSKGAGTGSATVASAAADNLAINGTTAGYLYPGDATGVEVDFTVDNPATFNQKVSKITLDSIGVDSGHSACATVLGTDFSMADVTVGGDGDIGPSSTGTTLSEKGALKMLDHGNQTACQGASLTLNFKSS
jgi:hypothetical protein